MKHLLDKVKILIGKPYEDLIKSPEILDAFLSHQATKNSLNFIKEQKGWKEPVQDVMIGYSDSNKDGGILASTWHFVQRPD